MALLAVIATFVLGCKSGLGAGNSQAQTLRMRSAPLFRIIWPTRET